MLWVGTFVTGNLKTGYELRGASARSLSLLKVAGERSLNRDIGRLNSLTIFLRTSNGLAKNKKSRARTLMAFTIASTVVFELLGPPLTMYSIRREGMRGLR